MKKLYIITYDLSNPGRNYETLLKKIMAYNDWARLGGSSYLITTAHSAIEIRDNLVQQLDSNDKIYVGLMGNSAAWKGLGDEVSNWIKNNQK
jgi:hypothetical protein